MLPQIFSFALSKAFTAKNLELINTLISFAPPRMETEIFNNNLNFFTNALNDKQLLEKIIAWGDGFFAKPLFAKAISFLSADCPTDTISLLLEISLSKTGVEREKLLDAWHASAATCSDNTFKLFIQEVLKNEERKKFLLKEQSFLSLLISQGKVEKVKILFDKLKDKAYIKELIRKANLEKPLLDSSAHLSTDQFCTLFNLILDQYGESEEAKNLSAEEIEKFKERSEELEDLLGRPASNFHSIVGRQNLGIVENFLKRVKEKTRKVFIGGKNATNQTVFHLIAEESKDIKQLLSVESTLGTSLGDDGDSPLPVFRKEILNLLFTNYGSKQELKDLLSQKDGKGCRAIDYVKGKQGKTVKLFVYLLSGSFAYKKGKKVVDTVLTTIRIKQSSAYSAAKEAATHLLKEKKKDLFIALLSSATFVCNFLYADIYLQSETYNLLKKHM